MKDHLTFCCSQAHDSSIKSTDWRDYAAKQFEQGVPKAEYTSLARFSHLNLAAMLDSRLTLVDPKFCCV